MVRKSTASIGGQGSRPTLNRKLTPLIAGKTIRSAVEEGGLLTLTFGDGWVMKVKTGQPAATDSLTGHTVKAVLQGGTEMELQFADGSTGIIRLAEETSSVLLRDQNGGFQYAD